MEKLTVHPRLAMRQERFGSNGSAFSLTGYIGPAPAGLVRLFSTPNTGEYIELPESAVVHAEQDSATLQVELLVNPMTILTAVSVAKMPLAALARQQQGGGPDAGTPKTCLEKRVEKCKNDPTVSNKAFCDSESGKHVFQLLCDLFGDPKTPAGGAVIL